MSDPKHETLPDSTQPPEDANTVKTDEPLYCGYTRFELELEVRRLLPSWPTLLPLALNIG